MIVIDRMAWQSTPIILFDIEMLVDSIFIDENKGSFLAGFG